MSNTKNAKTALVNKTSAGKKYFNNTLVETKVAPHMICVPHARTCPNICFLSLVICFHSPCLF